MSFKESFEDMKFWETMAQKTRVEFEQKRDEHDQARKGLERKEAEYRQKRTEVAQIENRLKEKQGECDQARSELDQKQVEYHQHQIDLEEKGIQHRHAAEQFQLRAKQLDDFEAFWRRHKSSTQQTNKDDATDASNSAAVPVSGGAAHTGESFVKDMQSPHYVSQESELFETPTNPPVRAEPYVTLQVRVPSWLVPNITEKPIMIPSRSRSSKQTNDSRKRLRKKMKSESEPDSENDSDDAEVGEDTDDELEQEMSQLEKPIAEPPAKRRRPVAGTYLMPLDDPTILDAAERAKLMAQFCKPIIPIFKSALRMVAILDTGVKLRREFGTLESMLQRDALTMEEIFWNWIESVKDMVRRSSFHYGTDRDVIVAKLQRWNDVYDECMHSCQEELYTNSQRVLAVDSAVNALKQEFATLGRDIVTIVKSDVLR